MTRRNERSTAMRGLLCQVQHIADTIEDEKAIRSLLLEAHIEPGIHEGVPRTDFTDDMKVEWLLGQWARTIDEAPQFLNILRTFSGHDAAEICGYVEAVA